MAVPVHHRHGVTGLHTGRREHVGQPRHTLDQGRVAIADLVTVNDLAGFLVTGAGHQQPFDQQWILVGPIGRGNDASLQHKNPFSDCTVLA
ncbi:hypothetical protein D3C87_1108340 [compost metagenome]